MLMMAYNYIEEARTNIRTLLDASRQFGLDINKDKSRFIIYNLEQQPEHITDEIKYLGLVLTNKRNIFTKQKHMINKAKTD